MTRTYNPARLDQWWKDVQKTDRKEWIRVSAEVGDYVQRLSGREDLIAVMEAGSADGNLAVWIPERAELRVDTDRCAEGIDPSSVRMDTETGRLRHPALTGACTHEGAHALASKWALDQNPKKRAVVAAALLLEESRAEKRLLKISPSQRVFLRAGFHALVKGADDPTDIAGAARLAALGMARVDAGVLDAAEMAPVKDVLVGLLTEELYDNLRKVWLKAHQVADDDQARMEALGQEWLDLLPEEAKDGGEGGIEIIVCGMPGGESEDGEGESATSKAAAAIGADAEAEAEDKVDAAKVADIHEAKSREADEVRKASQTAAKVFQHGHGHADGGHEGVTGHIDPSVKVRMMANQLAAAIRKAQHRDRSKTVVPSVTPPGRLRGNVAVQRAAQRAQGMPPTAEPWRQVVRKHVDQPPVKCGVMLDVSGSMRWAEQPVAEAAWAIGHAITRNEGMFATVGYGNSVHAIVKPGEAPRQMAVLNCGGGTEVPIEAGRALDGALGLSSGTGVRLLVVVSDGQYTHTQRAGFKTVLQRLTKTGCKVLWVDMASGGSNPITMPGIEVVTIRRGDDLGRLIGAALTKALSAA